MSPWDPDRIAARLEGLVAAVVDPPPARRAAVAALLRFEPGPAVLLMRRVEREEDPWSGQISLPGGRHEEQDADLLATAVRETREEVGVDLDTQGRMLGRLAPIPARARGGPIPMDVSPFVFEATGEVAPVLGEEAEQTFWLPLDRAARGELDHRFPYRNGDTLLELPSWRFDGRIVWGMTHRILGALLEVVGA